MAWLGHASALLQAPTCAPTPACRPASSTQDLTPQPSEDTAAAQEGGGGGGGSGGADVGERVKALVATTTLHVFNYTAQGLYERHKLLVATQLCMRILHKQGALSAEKWDYMLRGPKVRADGWAGPAGWWTAVAAAGQGWWLLCRQPAT